jgi:benzylsuccinate CoA-transferase BbsF subunit/naphthyl-2-methylsuccinate CoA transferase subunit
VNVLPLEGVRIIDLTVVWSGPGATALLGDLGAEVIRPEGVYRINRMVSAKVTKAALAGRAVTTYADADPGPRPYDRSSIFNWHSRNKLSVAMCLERREGREAFLRLAECSDVLVENNSPGVLEKLDLGWEVLHEVNPRLIVARMPPLGLTGPMCDYLGYGPNFNSLIGIQAMDGYEGGDPTTAGANYHMDEAAPGGLAFAVLAALWRREMTGTGQMIEFPQAENVMVEIGEYFLDYQMNERTPKVMGNSDPVLFQDVFLTSEPDTWVAISVRHDRDWEHLVSVVGCADDLAAGKTVMGRREHADALKAVVASWTATRPADEVVDRLQAGGVPAQEVMSELRVLEDAHLDDRQWFQERSHPAIGTHRYIGHPWRAEGFALAWGRPVPSFGEDNEYVYKEILGYEDAAYRDLIERGLIADEQRV